MNQHKFFKRDRKTRGIMIRNHRLLKQKERKDFKKSTAGIRWQHLDGRSVSWENLIVRHSPFIRKLIGDYRIYSFGYKDILTADEPNSFSTLVRKVYHMGDCFIYRFYDYLSIQDIAFRLDERVSDFEKEFVRYNLIASGANKYAKTLEIQH